MNTLTFKKKNMVGEKEHNCSSHPKGPKKASKKEKKQCSLTSKGVHFTMHCLNLD